MQEDQVVDVSIEDGSSISFWECPVCLAVTFPEGKAGHVKWHQREKRSWLKLRRR